MIVYSGRKERQQREQCTEADLFALRLFQVFHAYERKRRADCVARQDELLKGRLMEEERAWELFARAQGQLFEATLDQVRGSAS